MTIPAFEAAAPRSPLTADVELTPNQLPDLLPGLQREFKGQLAGVIAYNKRVDLA
jgi:hypothetical protein